jgi:DNA-binding transcriptional ArsR family regulator
LTAIFLISNTERVSSTVFDVLADPTRQRLIRALRAGEQSVGDLVERVDINQPGVSKQLRVLQGAGFVKVRPDRQRRLYSLRAEPFRELDAWMDGYRHLWEGRIDRLGGQIAHRSRARLEREPQKRRREEAR